MNSISRPEQLDRHLSAYLDDIRFEISKRPLINYTGKDIDEAIQNSPVLCSAVDYQKVSDPILNLICW